MKKNKKTASLLTWWQTYFNSKRQPVKANPKQKDVGKQIHCFAARWNNNLELKIISDHVHQIGNTFTNRIKAIFKFIEINP